jgi:hypothetical protein
MPAALRERLKEMAETNKRSLNAEIIYHLERIAFDPLAARLETDRNAGRGSA